MQLCRGASDEERQLYLLPPAADLASFAYLSGSGCTTIADMDDAAEFGRVKRALAAVGIAPEQQRGLFALLAAVLWLGNVRFAALHEDAVEVEAGSMGAVGAAAALLGCGEAALVAALTTRRMLAGGERITRELNMEAALDNRDALAKAIYATLFKWLVEQARVVWHGWALQSGLPRHQHPGLPAAAAAAARRSMPRWRWASSRARPR